MPRNRRNKLEIEINMETHPLNDQVLPELRVPMTDVQWVKDNMPNQAIMDGDMHGWKHILHMLVYASALCEYADSFDLAVVKWAILLHDAGRYEDHLEESLHGLMSASVFARMWDKAAAAGQPIAVNREHIIAIVSHHNKTDASQSTEEAVVRTCDRLDLWRIPGFSGLNPEFMEAPGWSKVEKMAQQMRLEA